MNASTARIDATIVPPSCVMSISLRRSKTSAATPLTSEKKMIGTHAHEPDHPERQPLARGRDEQRDVPENRRLLHERSGKRHEEADPQQPEVAVAQRARVREQSRGHGEARQDTAAGFGPSAHGLSTA